MFGVFLAGISGAFDEIANSIGKRKITDGRESYYTFGFLTQFVSAVSITVIGFALADMRISPDSFPTFIPRIVLAVLQLQLMVIAIARVDRGSYGFIRLAAIPLILAADLMLGYPLKNLQILGIILIVLPIGTLFYLEYSKSKDMALVLFIAFLAAIDITLFKYDITHFNSVESEQAITSLVISLYFFLTATLIRGENPLAFLREKVYLLQSGSSGVAYVINSFAYLYAPASVINSAYRGATVLFSILSGTYYFKEQGFLVRLALFIVVAIGLVLLV